MTPHTIEPELNRPVPRHFRPSIRSSESLVW